MAPHERGAAAGWHRRGVRRVGKPAGVAADSGRARHVVGVVRRRERRIQPFEVRLHVVQFGQQPLDAAGMARRPLRIGVDDGQFLAQAPVLAGQLLAGEVFVAHENSMSESCVQRSMRGVPDSRGSGPTT